MNRDDINGRRLVGLFLLGVLVFNFPLLSLFNRPVAAWGIPVLYLYLFAAWLLVILLTRIASKSKSDTSPPPDHGG